MPKKSLRKTKKTSSVLKKSATKNKKAVSRKTVSRKTQKFLEKTKKIATITLLFIISAAFLSGYYFYKRFTKEYASAFSASSYEISSEDIFSVAYIKVDDFQNDPLFINSVSLLIFDKGMSKIISYNIPTDTLIDVPGIYGDEPFYNIMAIGHLDGGNDYSQSISLIVNSIEKAMTFPVDRYIIVDKSTHSLADMLLSGTIDLSNVNITFDLVKRKVKMNLSLDEVYDIYQFTKALPQDRFIEKTLKGSYIDDPNLLDEELMDITFDSLLSREKKSIAILNGTEFTGVATYGSRIVKNFGGRVVVVGNTHEMYEKSIIITDDLNSETVRIISHIFNINNIILDSDARNINENEINRSDVSIIFGLDFAKSL